MIEKFNYQIVFKSIASDLRIIFVGSTSLVLDVLLDKLMENLSSSIDYYVESVNFGPLTNVENGTKKE